MSSEAALERAEDLIELRVAQALERPLMHGITPREFEMVTLALMEAWELVTTRDPGARGWFEAWREECKARGLGSGQSLAHLPAAGDWQASFHQTAKLLGLVFERLKTSVERKRRP